MEALASPAVVPVIPAAPRTPYVPALPTLWPSMLWGRRHRLDELPFTSSSATWFYFARNAVWHAVRVLGLQGAEVLVPAYHHGVEVEALIDAGADVAFYPVDAGMRVDVGDIESRVGPRTRAIYLVHYLGFPGPAHALRELCDRLGLALIEDCALSLFSRDGALPLGNVGDASIFCLYKSLPVPHGGALVLPRGGTARVATPAKPPGLSTVHHAASSLLSNLQLRGGPAGAAMRRGLSDVGRWVGQATQNVPTGTQHFDRHHLALGMSPLAGWLAGARRAQTVVEHRRRNFFRLLSRLQTVAPPVFHDLPAGVCPLFYPLRVDHKLEVAESLAAQGIETVDFWSVGHPSCDLARFPDVAELRRTVLEIPCHQDLTPEVIDWIADRATSAVRASQ